MRAAAAAALCALFAAACGGGDPPGASPTASAAAAAPALAGRPEPQALVAAGSSTTALRLYQAWYGMAPSYAQQQANASQALADGGAALSRQFAADYATMSDAAVAARVLGNLRTSTLSVNSASYEVLATAVAQIFAAYGPALRGQVVLNLVNILVTLETDAVYGAAARAYNAQVAANASYSGTASNTSASSTVRTASWTSHYNDCYIGTPAMYTTAYCAAYASAREVGASAATANQQGAIAAGGNVGNIGTGQVVTSSGSTSTSGTRSGNVNWTSSYSADELIEDSSTLAANSRKGWTFSISNASAPMEMIFAAQYSADLYIVDGSSVNACVNGGAFSYYSSWSYQGQYGFQSMTIPPGSYGLCVVNKVNQSNAIRMEFQRQPTVTGFRYEQAAFSPVVRNVGAGGRVTQPVTSGATWRVIVDGGNTGGSFYVIPASEQSNFLAGRSFQQYTSISCSSGRAAPGLCELTGIGDYAIAYVNDTTTTQAIVVVGRIYVPD